jgi:hypothetical protein
MEMVQKRLKNSKKTVKIGGHDRAEGGIKCFTFHEGMCGNKRTRNT